MIGGNTFQRQTLAEIITEIETVSLNNQLSEIEFIEFITDKAGILEIATTEISKNNSKFQEIQEYLEIVKEFLANPDKKNKNQLVNQTNLVSDLLEKTNSDYATDEKDKEKDESNPNQIGAEILDAGTSVYKKFREKEEQKKKNKEGILVFPIFAEPDPENPDQSQGERLLSPFRADALSSTSRLEKKEYKKHITQRAEEIASLNNPQATIRHLQLAAKYHPDSQVRRYNQDLVTRTLAPDIWRAAAPDQLAKKGLIKTGEFLGDQVWELTKAVDRKLDRKPSEKIKQVIGFGEAVSSWVSERVERVSNAIQTAAEVVTNPIKLRAKKIYDSSTFKAARNTTQRTISGVKTTWRVGRSGAGFVGSGGRSALVGGVAGAIIGGPAGLLIGAGIGTGVGITQKVFQELLETPIEKLNQTLTGKVINVIAGEDVFGPKITTSANDILPKIKATDISATNIPDEVLKIQQQVLGNISELDFNKLNIELPQLKQLGSIQATYDSLNSNFAKRVMRFMINNGIGIGISGSIGNVVATLRATQGMELSEAGEFIFKGKGRLISRFSTAVDAVNGGSTGLLIGSAVGNLIVPGLGGLVGGVAGASVGVLPKIIGDRFVNSLFGAGGEELIRLQSLIPLDSAVGLIQGYSMIGSYVRTNLFSEEFFSQRAITNPDYERIAPGIGERNLYSMNSPLGIAVNTIGGLAYVADAYQLYYMLLENGGLNAFFKFINSTKVVSFLARKSLGVSTGAFIGAALGSFIGGPIGALIGAGVGAGIGYFAVDSITRQLSNIFGSTAKIAIRGINLARIGGGLVGGTVGSILGAVAATFLGLPVGIAATVGGAIGTGVGLIVGNSLGAGAAGLFAVGTGGIGTIIAPLVYGVVNALTVAVFTFVGQLAGSYIDKLFRGPQINITNPLTLLLGAYNFKKLVDGIGRIRNLGDWGQVALLFISSLSFIVIIFDTLPVLDSGPGSERYCPGGGFECLDQDNTSRINGQEKDLFTASLTQTEDNNFAINPGRIGIGNVLDITKDENTLITKVYTNEHVYIIDNDLNNLIHDKENNLIYGQVNEITNLEIINHKSEFARVEECNDFASEEICNTDIAQF